jgi:hypothetical protein
MSSVAAVVADRDRSTSRFLVQARAEPGVMPRVLELFAKRGLVPTRWRSAVSDTGDHALTIEIDMPGLSRLTTDYLAACMRQIGFVDAVLTMETAAD